MSAVHVRLSVPYWIVNRCGLKLLRVMSRVAKLPVAGSYAAAASALAVKQAAAAATARTRASEIASPGAVRARTRLNTAPAQVTPLDAAAPAAASYLTAAEGVATLPERQDGALPGDDGLDAGARAALAAAGAHLSSEVRDAACTPPTLPLI